MDRKYTSWKPKKGDIVIATGTSVKSLFYEPGFIKGSMYTVSKDYNGGSLSVEKDSNGTPNGWSIDFFIPGTKAGQVLYGQK